MMGSNEIIDILLGAVAMLGAAIAKYMFGRIKDNTEKLDQLRVDMATQGQENKELYSHIKRIDNNITEIYRKLDDLLIAVNKKS
jgi:septal ring factor EnvC (AmiA/AmiB activator)